MSTATNASPTPTKVVAPSPTDEPSVPGMRNYGADRLATLGGPNSAAQPESNASLEQRQRAEQEQRQKHPPLEPFKPITG